MSGSISLVHALLAADLVDELRLAVYPIVPGTGRRMFGESDRRDFTPVDVSLTSTGVQLVTLRRTEAPAEVEFDYEKMRAQR